MEGVLRSSCSGCRVEVELGLDPCSSGNEINSTATVCDPCAPSEDAVTGEADGSSPPPAVETDKEDKGLDDGDVAKFQGEMESVRN